MKRSAALFFTFGSLSFMGCAGIKVVNPNDENKNKGTLAVDVAGGNFNLVETYTCYLESMGKRHSALGKTKAEATREVVAKCKDNTLFSNCEAEKVKCQKN